MPNFENVGNRSRRGERKRSTKHVMTQIAELMVKDNIDSERAMDSIRDRFTAENVAVPGLLADAMESGLESWVQILGDPAYAQMLVEAEQRRGGHGAGGTQGTSEWVPYEHHPTFLKEPDDKFVRDEWLKKLLGATDKLSDHGFWEPEASDTDNLYIGQKVWNDQCYRARVTDFTRLRAQELLAKRSELVIADIGASSARPQDRGQKKSDPGTTTRRNDRWRFAGARNSW